MRKERKRKMKKEIKKFLVMILTAMLVIGFMSGGAAKVYAGTGDVTASYDEAGKKINASYTTIQQKATSTKIYLKKKSGDSWAEVKRMGKGNGSISVSFEVADFGTYRIDIEELDYNMEVIETSTSEEIVVGGGSSDNDDSSDASNPKVVNLPADDKTTSFSWTQMSADKNKVRHYFKLVVAEKTWYNFYNYDANKGITAELYKGESQSGDALYTTTTLFTQDDKLLDKGTYLLVAYGATDGSTYSMPIKSRDFKDIKKINCKDTYEVYQGTTKIAISYEPADFESTVKWSKGDENFSVDSYDSNAKINLEPTEAIICANALGEFTSTITTSEGVSKTIKVMVKPRPTQVSYAEAVTKSKSKATIKLEWSGDANWYKVYQKSSKDKDFKVVKETSDSKVTLTTKPNMNFTYKIESCYKKDGKIVSSSMGEGVGAMTAPYKAPTLKSAKQKGGTKYVKPYTKSVWHPATKSRAGHYETLKLGNQSNASVKVKIKKVGAKYYEANKGNTNAISQGTNVVNYFKNKLSFTYKGKIGGKTEKIKVRGVWKKGVCTAYGPWSKTKKVKIKGNK